MKRLALSLLCAPMDFLGFLLASLATLGSRPTFLRVEGCLCVRPAAGSFLARNWCYSTTLGHVILWHPEHDERVLAHELVHVLQAEACCVAWWSLTLLAWSPVLLWLSPFGWLGIYGAFSVAAWLSGARPYLGNAFERHARAEGQRAARD